MLVKKKILEMLLHIKDAANYRPRDSQPVALAN